MLGIVILNFNSFNNTEKCIEHIENSVHIDYRVFLIDNCSTDNSFELALEKYKNYNNIHIERTEKNGGYSYGNNIGIQRAKEIGCDAVLICNPDVVVLDNAIDSLYKALFSSDIVGAAVPTVLDYYRNKALQSRRVLDSEQIKYECSFFNSKQAGKFYFDFDKMPKDCNGNYLFDGKSTGCCIMLKSKLFESFLSIYDENMFLYFEEDVLAQRLHELGMCTIYVPVAEVWHNHMPSTSNRGNAFARFCAYKSLVYYAKAYCKVSSKILKKFQKKLYIKFKIFSIFEKDYKKYLIELKKYFKWLLNN